MENETETTSFPKTGEDLNNLSQTASDAARELGNKAAEHAGRAKSQLKDLAGHAQEEGQQKVEQLQGSFSSVADAARSYITERPIAAVGVALLVGFIYGRGRRGSR